MVANDFKVKNAAPHDPSRGIRVLSSKTIAHFLNFKKNIYHFLITNAGLALDRHEHIG